MKKSLLILLCTIGISVVAFSQYGESITEVRKFTNSERKFNDWSVGVYGGIPLMQSADLTSFRNGGSNSSFFEMGYDFQLGVSKAINHVVAIQLLGTLGESNQGYADFFKTRTRYQSVSILGDLNLTSIFRRVDNKSPYRWALHLYGGPGILGYKTYASIYDGDYEPVTDQPLDQASFFMQMAVGLKYKISRRLDAEFKITYLMSGDDEFDGGGEQHQQFVTPAGVITPNDFEEQTSDNMVQFHLGLAYKFGKHKEHLQWFDPLQDLYPPVKGGDGGPDVPGCISGDNDQDGVCDDWDKELDSPAGCRVDGSGVCLDTDLDGIIDLYDKCPTYPSTNKENGGCPTLQELLDGINNQQDKANGDTLPPIEFELDSDKITGESIPTMQNIVSILKQFYKGEPIIVEGHTDTYGKPDYNLGLSDRRVKSVIRYLGENGIDTKNFTGVGMGEKDLKYPECRPASKCPDWKNRANRRVVFQIAK